MYDNLKEQFKKQRVQHLRNIYRKLLGHDSRGKQKKQMIREIAIHSMDEGVNIEDISGKDDN